MTRGIALPLRGGLAALACLILTAGCEDLQVVSADPDTVAVSPSEGELLPGDSVQLNAVVRDHAGNPLPDRQIAWTSDDDEIASVGPEGMVTALAPGTTSVRAATAGVEGQATIVVWTPPRITVGQPRIRFLATTGEAPPSAVWVEVRQEGEWPLSGLSISVRHPDGEPGGWLVAELAADSAPTNLMLAAATEGLTEGTYHANVEIHSPVAGNSPRLLEVELELAAQAPRIHLGWSAVGFAWEEGQLPPPPQSVPIENAGGGGLTGLEVATHYGDGVPTGWLEANLGSSTAPTTLSVQVDPDALRTGVYEARLTVSSPVASNSPQELPIRLTVGDPPPLIGLTPEQVELRATRGGAPPSSREIAVENRGGGVITDLETSVGYGADGPQGWLKAVLESSTTPTTLTLDVVSTDLEPGTHQAIVLVESFDAANSPQQVSVSLLVARPWVQDRSLLRADPDTLTADGASVSTIVVELRDEDGALVGSGGHHVSLDATGQGTLGSVTDHGDGRYTAALTAPEVTGTTTIRARINDLELDDEAQVTFVPGPASPATSTISADPESIRVGWSSTSEITVRLRDAKGNPLVQGGDSVVLHHSGGGSLGPVSDRGDGTYTATLTSPVLPGSATITGEVNGDEIEDSATVQFVLLSSAMRIRPAALAFGEPALSGMERTLQWDPWLLRPYISVQVQSGPTRSGLRHLTALRSSTET